MRKLLPVIKPLLMNNLEFATAAQSVSGHVNWRDLQRLSDLLDTQLNPQNTGKIDYQLSGSTQKYKQPSLHINIHAELPAVCQRCLSEMIVLLNLNFDYLISDNEPAELDENADLDWLESSREMNVWELIEDELLLAFPIAPVHLPEQQQACIAYNSQSGEKPNPFAVLKNFSKKTG